jgi:hypothetical protein
VRQLAAAPNAQAGLRTPKSPLFLAKRMYCIMEEPNKENALEEDLKKVETESIKKSIRHRLDEYIAIALGVGAVLLLWILQELGLY